MSGGGSTEGQAQIQTPNEPTEAQKQLETVQAALAQEALRQLQTQQGIQRIFFGEAFPQESVQQFRTDAQSLRDQAETLMEKASSLRSGESRVPLTPQAKAFLGQTENDLAASNQEPALSAGQIQGNALNTFMADRVRSSQLQQGEGAAQTLENQANELIKRANRLEEQAQGVEAAPEHRRQFFTQPLVSPEARQNAINLIEQDLASRTPLGQATPQGFNLGPVDSKLGIFIDPLANRVRQ
jgi:HSP90 family molecular chaperone